MSSRFGVTSEQLALGALERAGFETTTITLNPQAYGSDELLFEDTQNNLDIHIDLNSRTDFSYSPLDRFRTISSHAPEYLWRGLLRHDIGRFTVEIMPEGRHLIPVQSLPEVEVITSPDGFNQTQETLGRTPGLDAFKMVRQPGRDYYSSGQYVEAFANMEAPAADTTTYWSFASHDLDPKFHAQSWLCTPPALGTKISGYAQSLVEQHGEAIHDTAQRPEEVVKFSSCMDDLQNFTNFFLRSVFDTQDPLNTRDNAGRIPDRSALLELFQLNKDYLERSYGFGKVLVGSGAVPRSLTQTEAKQEIHQTMRQIVSHIGSLLLILEEVKPLSHDSPRRRTSRMNILNHIVKSFGEKE